MARDLINARIQLLRDTEYDWSSVADSFVPLAGEPCITVDGDNAGRVKYGDGVTVWGELPYSNDNSYDNLSIKSIDHVIQLYGFKDATSSQVPRKSESGSLEWFTPVEIKEIKLGNEETLTPTESGSVTIPVGSLDTLGVVKASKEIDIEDDGTLNVLKIGADKIEGLSPASGAFNPHQFSTVDMVSIVNVDSSLISYKSETLEDTLDNLVDTTTWKKF